MGEMVFTAMAALADMELAIKRTDRGECQQAPRSGEGSRRVPTSIHGELDTQRPSAGRRRRICHPVARDLRMSGATLYRRNVKIIQA